MKIEKINENKIRITLNMDDLSKRNIDLHSFMSNSIESQHIFLDMLDEADKTVGFNTDDCKLMVEALALNESSFILTVTRFKQSLDDSTYLPKKKLHIKRKSPVFNLNKTIYSFDNFDDFCEFCELIKTLFNGEQISDFAQASDLFEYNSKYYLIFSNINTDSKILKQFCSIITEFASFVNNSEIFDRKIKEYRKKDN